MNNPNPPLIWRDVEKSFGRHEALRGVSATVPRGSISGFVGLNGAGKTTSLECSLGLLKGYGGEIEILGGSPRELPRKPGRLGVVFDTPCVHPHLSVRATLEHAHRLSGGGGRRPDDVMGLLGLERYRRFATRKLSLGNRRRTSIGTALVGQPELLILDEPFSGLDAEGVDDLLALLRRLRDEEGLTVVLSSHQLHLVERVCSHLSVIDRGRILCEGAVETLLAGRTHHLEVDVDDPARARSALAGCAGIAKIVDRPGGLLIDFESAARVDPDPAAVNRILVSAGIGVTRLVPHRPSLDELFRELVGTRDEA